MLRAAARLSPVLQATATFVWSDMHLTLRRGCAQLPHIRTPFFVSNSQFDSWSMGSILGAQAYISLCPADQKSYGTCSTNCKTKLQRFSAHSCFRQHVT